MCYVCGSDTVRDLWLLEHYSLCPVCYALAHGRVPEDVANEHRDADALSAPPDALLVTRYETR